VKIIIFPNIFTSPHSLTHSLTASALEINAGKRFATRAILTVEEEREHKKKLLLKSGEK
jgi:hypothetical protein